MNQQHRIRGNQQRERRKSLRRTLAENRACFEFLKARSQVDIDDKTEAENVQGTSTKD